MKARQCTGSDGFDCHQLAHHSKALHVVEHPAYHAVSNGGDGGDGSTSSSSTTTSTTTVGAVVTPAPGAPNVPNSDLTTTTTKAPVADKDCTAILAAAKTAWPPEGNPDGNTTMVSDVSFHTLRLTAKWPDTEKTDVEFAAAFTPAVRECHRHAAASAEQKPKTAAHGQAGKKQKKKKETTVTDTVTSFYNTPRFWYGASATVICCCVGLCAACFALLRYKKRLDAHLKLNETQKKQAMAQSYLNSPMGSSVAGDDAGEAAGLMAAFGKENVQVELDEDGVPRMPQNTLLSPNAISPGGRGALAQSLRRQQTGEVPGAPGTNDADAELGKTIEPPEEESGKKKKKKKKDTDAAAEEEGECVVM